MSACLPLASPLEMLPPSTPPPQKKREKEKGCLMVLVDPSDLGHGNKEDKTTPFNSGNLYLTHIIMKVEQHYLFLLLFLIDTARNALELSNVKHIFGEVFGNLKITLIHRN